MKEARCAKRKTVYFHNALNKYGEENFKFEEIDSATTQEELNDKERYWIKYYNSNDKNKGYNLDSGGLYGGAKSEETKKKIGETTKEKWRNPKTSSKMLEGLRKGNETSKKRAKMNKILGITYSSFKCPVCGKIIYEENWKAKKRKYCSNKCVAESEAWKKGVNNSARISHERNMKKKKIIKKDIIEWVNSNFELVINCPYNKISTTLHELFEIINQNYGIKDKRSLYICFDVKNLKSFLDKLKEIAYISKQNVC